MKVCTTLVALVLGLAAPLVWGEQTVDEPVTESEILAVQTKRFKAMTESDIEALETLFADDLIYTHTTGTIESKPEFLESIQGDVQYRSIEPRESHVRLYGNIAVVTGIAAMQVSAGERQLAFSIRFTEVYHKTDHGWQLVSWQSTRLPQR